MIGTPIIIALSILFGSFLVGIGSSFKIGDTYRARFANFTIDTVSGFLYFCVIILGVLDNALGILVWNVLMFVRLVLLYAVTYPLFGAYWLVSGLFRLIWSVPCKFLRAIYFRKDCCEEVRDGLSSIAFEFFSGFLTLADHVNAVIPSPAAMFSFVLDREYNEGPCTQSAFGITMSETHKKAIEKKYLRSFYAPLTHSSTHSSPKKVFVYRELLRFYNSLQLKKDRAIEIEKEICEKRRDSYLLSIPQDRQYCSQQGMAPAAIQQQGMVYCGQPDTVYPAHPLFKRLFKQTAIRPIFFESFFNVITCLKVAHLYLHICRPITQSERRAIIPPSDIFEAYFQKLYSWVKKNIISTAGAAPADDVCLAMLGAYTVRWTDYTCCEKLNKDIFLQRISQRTGVGYADMCRPEGISFLASSKMGVLSAVFLYDVEELLNDDNCSRANRADLILPRSGNFFRGLMRKHAEFDWSSLESTRSSQSRLLKIPICNSTFLNYNFLELLVQTSIKDACRLMLFPEDVSKIVITNAPGTVHNLAKLDLEVALTCFLANWFKSHSADQLPSKKEINQFASFTNAMYALHQTIIFVERTLLYWGFYNRDHTRHDEFPFGGATMRLLNKRKQIEADLNTDANAPYLQQRNKNAKCLVMAIDYAIYFLEKLNLKKQDLCKSKHGLNDLDLQQFYMEPVDESVPSEPGTHPTQENGKQLDSHPMSSEPRAPSYQQSLAADFWSNTRLEHSCVVKSALKTLCSSNESDIFFVPYLQKNLVGKKHSDSPNRSGLAVIRELAHYTVQSINFVTSVSFALSTDVRLERAINNIADALTSYNLCEVLPPSSYECLVEPDKTVDGSSAVPASSLPNGDTEIPPNERDQRLSVILHTVLEFYTCPGVRSYRETLDCFSKTPSLAQSERTAPVQRATLGAVSTP